MKILNFLFYHLSYWFEVNTNLEWSSPTERASYALGLFTVCITYSIYTALQYTMFKGNDAFSIPSVAFIIEGLFAIWLFDFIYIKNGKYATLSFSEAGKEKGAIISVVVLLVGIFSPFLMFVLFIPFGGHKNISH